MAAPREGEVTLETVRRAGEAVLGFTHRTPIMTCCSVDEMIGDGRRAFFKVS
jgi:hypothetical protein